MALYFFENKIEIMIPNSEASIIAQHIGIKDRTVGSYYMSENYEGVREFFDNFEGKLYLDLIRTKSNMEKLYNYIIAENKVNLFKSNLVEQLTLVNEIETNEKHGYYEINMPMVNDNQKYIKFSREENATKLFQDLLLGDLTKIIVIKLNKNTFIMYGDTIDNYQDQIDVKFHINEELINEE